MENAQITPEQIFELNHAESITELEESGWIGADACLATSLFEYGLIWKQDEAGDRFDFIYGLQVDTSGNYYTFNRHNGNKLEDISLEQDYNWIDDEDFKKDNEDLNETPQLMAAIASHYGTECAYGSAYHGGFRVLDWEQEEALKTLAESIANQE